MEQPKTLYKFVAPERVDILKNQRIRFTQPSALNDPFELQPIFGEILSNEDWDEVSKPNIIYFEESLNKHLSHIQTKTRKKLIKAIVSKVKKIHIFSRRR